MKNPKASFIALLGGLLIGAAVTLVSGSAHAQSATGVTVAYVWHGLEGPIAQAVSSSGQILGSISPYASGATVSPAVNAAAGAATQSATSTISVGVANGAKVASKVPVGLIRTFNPLTIAKIAVRATPLGIASVVILPALIEAGLQYSNGKWSQLQTPILVGTKPGFLWKFGSGNYSTGEAACIAGIAEFNALHPSATSSQVFNYIVYPGTGASWMCWSHPANNTSLLQNVATVSLMTTCIDGFVKNAAGTLCVAPAVAVDVTQDQAENVLAASLPTSSVSPASIVNAVPSSTVIPDTVDPVVSGPAQVLSPPVVTTNNVNNSTTTTTHQTVVNNTYNNNTVTSTVINQTVVKDSTGAVISTTNEGGVTDPTKEDVLPVSDTAMPDLPKLYERKYPDGMEGVWNTRSAEIKASPLFSLSAVFKPSVSAGSCPAWTFDSNIGPHMMFGSGSFAPPCWIWAALKSGFDYHGSFDFSSFGIRGLIWAHFRQG